HTGSAECPVCRPDLWTDGQDAGPPVRREEPAMERPVGRGHEDRRGVPRHRDVEAHGILAARVRPGHRAMLIDISTTGALIETEHRLLPGTSVELMLERRHYRAGVKGRVLRCAIVRMHASSVCYRGAIRFDRGLPWFVEPERVDPTQQVL